MMKNSPNLIVKYLCMSAIMVCGLTTPNAHAQEASVDNPPEIISPDIMPEKETEESSVILTSTADPCPEPKAALGETPNDLKLIQEDITRFTLCLQRAQLLDRLNDLATQNLDGIQTSLDEKIKNNFGDIMQPAMLDNIPFPDIASANDTMPVSNDAVISSPEPEAPEWFVSDIMGKDNQLKAKLIDINGNIVYVSKSEKLPNSEIKVKSISSTDVKITDNGNDKILMWNNSAEGSASNVQ